MTRRNRLPLLPALLVASVLVLGAAASGPGCAQIIGADFDKPFATGGGGAASGTGTTSDASTSGSMTTSDTSGSTSTGPGPLCGNGTCDPDETNCNCAGDGCLQKVGDGCCEAPENKCDYPIECANQQVLCGDHCCDLGEDHGTCPDDCGIGCPDGTCDMPGGENCSECGMDCKCGMEELCSAGDCKKANGVGCTDPSECGSDACVGTDCTTGTCTTMLCCATACTACQECAADGSGCVDLATSPACTTNPACVGGLCQCADGAMDGLESDVDCGSDCAGQLCADGLHCGGPGDCTNGFCCDCGDAGLLCASSDDCVANCPMP